MPEKSSAGIGKGSRSTSAYIARYWRSGAAKKRGPASPGRTDGGGAYEGGAYEGSGSDQRGGQKKRKQSWADALPMLERAVIATQAANKRLSVMSKHGLGCTGSPRSAPTAARLLAPFSANR